MKDYSYLSNELINAVRSLDSYQSYAVFCSRHTYSEIAALEHSDFPSDRQCYQIINLFGISAFIDACKFVHNAYMRTTRVRSRIRLMADSFPALYFCTFTISDTYINRFDMAFFSTQLKSILRSVSPLWILNEDYGDSTNRLHFHAVCVNADGLSDLWTYGFSSIRCLPLADDGEIDRRRVSRYMTKLCRHATKSSAGHIWYSRINH